MYSKLSRYYHLIHCVSIFFSFQRCQNKRESCFLDTYLNNPVVQGFGVLLELLPDDEVNLVVSEGAESFGLKFVSILHDDLSLFEMRCNLAGGKVDVCGGGTESYAKTSTRYISLSLNV